MHARFWVGKMYIVYSLSLKQLLTVEFHVMLSKNTDEIHLLTDITPNGQTVK